MIDKNEKPTLEHESLSRSLKNRHIQMIAIGGAIGVGLFYGATGAIQSAGPSIIFAYLAVGIVIYFIMRALGEMTVEEPISGSYVTYASRYISPFTGYYLGWTALLTMAAGSAAEYAAIGHYIQFWVPDFPVWVSAFFVLCLVILINTLSVKAYGEIEFWLSLIKVIAIIGMIILGGAMLLFGIGNGGQPVGFDNLTNNGGLFPLGVKGWILSLVLVAFAFGGVEIVGVAAAEAGNVKKTIPQAINGVFWRILIFYVGAITIMVSLFDWSGIGEHGSPFVTVFEKIGIPGAASVINLVIIAAAISALNSGIYSATRVLYSLSLQGKAPSIISKLNKNKVPFISLLIVIATQLFGVLMNYIMPASAFEIFSTIVVVGLISNWLSILFSQLKFRKAKINSGEVENLLYKMPFWPYSSYFAIAFMLSIIVIMAFMPYTRVALYVAPVWICILFISYKISGIKIKETENVQEKLVP
ncbi:amino acid permease [Lysinibacillus boronitolerans]|uniref:amino acid permease n=1 Tax=Lysinibacillus boronitolerans TaxID=309788 RepID=UPI003851951D